MTRRRFIMRNVKRTRNKPGTYRLYKRKKGKRIYDGHSGKVQNRLTDTYYGRANYRQGKAKRRARQNKIRKAQYFDVTYKKDKRQAAATDRRTKSKYGKYR